MQHTQEKSWKTYVQVREGSLMTYDYPEEGFTPPCWRKPPTKPTYTGTITHHARQRIIRAVDILLQQNQPRRIYNPITHRNHDFRISFATLTISDLTDPDIQQGNEALAIWLRHFRKPWGKKKMSEPLKEYVWKAELQKRGNLHYHITSGSFLHLVEVNKVWNDIQRKYGWTNTYHAKTGSWQPPSTDVRSVHRVKNLGAYIAKYMGKKDQNGQALKGKIWGCSEGLRGKKRFAAEMDEETWENLAVSYGKGEIEVREMERCKFLHGASPSQLSDVQILNYKNWLS